MELREQLRELDCEVAERIMGWSGPVQWCGEGTPDDPLGPYMWEPDTVPVSRTENLIVPSFSTDLNACFEAQAKCIERLGQVYADELLLHVGGDGGSAEDAFEPLITASAKQRCVAMLKALDAMEGK